MSNEINPMAFFQEPSVADLRLLACPGAEGHGAGLPPVSDAERTESGASTASERGNSEQAGSNFE